MSQTRKPWYQQIFMLPLMLVIGALLAYAMVFNKKELSHEPGGLPEKTVSVIKVQKLPFRASVVAYGNVEPSISLKSKAQVSGKVSFVHPDLKQGMSLTAGTVVLRIEASDYEVLLKQTEADLKANQLALSQLEQEEKTALRSLELVKENLAVGEKEFARINELFEQKLVSRSTLDGERQKVISLRQQLEDIQGQLNTFDSRKDTVKANIVRAEQQVESQKTNLGRTEISLPFNARIGEVAVEKDEFVSVGNLLFEASNVTGVEIVAQLPTRQMSRLVSHLENAPLDDFRSVAANNIIRQLDLSAHVSLVGSLSEAKWQGNVLRLGESIDTTRRTLSIVIGVDKPYDKVVPGRRPPLLKGMYMAVKLMAPEQEAIVIPRRAIHHGRVYIVKKDEPVLAIRPVTIKFFQEDLAIIRKGLEPGDQVIVSDVFPVIEGMPLKVIPAEKVAKQVKQAAAGEA